MGWKADGTAHGERMMQQLTYEEVFSVEHLLISAKECCSNVRWKSSTQLFEASISTWVYRLHKSLMDGTYKPKEYMEFDIVERGKVRHIKALHITDRCVQKCLCKFFLKPLLVPKLIYDSAANVETKGTEFAIKRLKKHLSAHYKKHGKEGGILLMDYKNYFGSINHSILLEMLQTEIQDDRLYGAIKHHIESYSGIIGLGLGSETSQILAVYYTNRIDHYIKEQLHIKGYGRYMDDCYLIHNDIEYLKVCMTEIERISNEMGLTLNSKTRICKLSGGFEYLKKRFFISDSGKIVTRLSRSNITRRRQVMKRMFDNDIPIEEIEQSYSCWKGYAKHYNTYNTRNQMDILFENCSRGKENKC